MTNVTENVADVTQIEETPDPQISETPVEQSLGQVKDEFVTLSEVKKLLQSEKDVRFGKYGTRLDNLEDAIDKYEALRGGEVDKKVLSKMVGEQDLADIKQELADMRSGDSGDIPAGAGVQPWGVRQDELLESAGLKKTDPRAVELAKSKPNWTVDEWLSELNDKSLEWRNADLNKPQPSSASVAQTTASIPSGSGEYTAASYGEAMLAASGNKAELNRIKARARADGVDVDNIGFA